MRVVASCLCSGSRACSASNGVRLEIPSVNRVSDCSRTMTACATASSRYFSVSCVACSCREVRSLCQRVEHPLPVLFDRSFKTAPAAVVSGALVKQGGAPGQNHVPQGGGAGKRNFCPIGLSPQGGFQAKSGLGGCLSQPRVAACCISAESLRRSGRCVRRSLGWMVNTPSGVEAPPFRDPEGAAWFRDASQESGQKSRCSWSISA